MTADVGVTILTAVFDGMDPWAPSSEIITCSGTSMGDVDLHNTCDLLGLNFTCGEGGPTLAIEFNKVEEPFKGELFLITFSGLKDMNIQMNPSARADDYKVFHAIDYIRDQDGRSEFSIETEMADVSLSCLRVNFVFSQ